MGRMPPLMPLGFRVPEYCPSCASSGQVVLETTVKGSLAILRWCCRQCSGEWPVTPEEEQIDRRNGPEERRATLRGDRRTA